MVASKRLSASSSAAFALFDPEEQAAFLEEVGAIRDELVERFTASDLLIWIVQHRSSFLRMAIEISELLNRIEASLKGNIEFVVSVQDGEEVDLFFGPQVRKLLLTASTWVDQTVPDFGTRVTALRREVRRFCQDARTTQMERDSSLGRQIRDLSHQHFDPLQRMRMENTADFLRQSEVEVHPDDVGLLSGICDDLSAGQRRIGDLLKGCSGAEEVLATLRRAKVEADQALHEIQGHLSRERDPPRPNLEKRRANRISRDIGEIESLARQAKRLDDTGADLMEAMGLSLWQERWRVYELWVLCLICLKLARPADAIDPMDRIQGGRWTLKFTRDEKPVLACRFGERWLDIYYQLFEQGADRANMPDIAIRDRTSGAWLAIVDPKMGESYRQRDMVEVCLRYADAFRPQATVIANYFPDVSRTDQLRTDPAALVCHGLRPASTAPLGLALSGACATVGIRLVTKVVVVLADVSSSTETIHDQITAAIEKAVRANPELDPSLSVVAPFNCGWIDHRNVEAFMAHPRLPPAAGTTDHDAAFREAVHHLESKPAPREIWLFGDGQNCHIDPAPLASEGIRIEAFISQGGLSASVRSLCEETGGRAVEIETFLSGPVEIPEA